MRFLVLAAALGAVAIPASSATAQNWRGGYHNNQRDVRQEVRECRRELRRADSRREYRRELRECQREIAQARRYNRYDRYDRHDRRGYGDRYRGDRGRY